MTVLKRIHAAIITPTPRSVTATTGVWWGVSIAIPILYGVMALHDGFSAERIVQDDARQYLFWMQRFQNPELFSNDLIADYFQSVTPLGYTFLYRMGTWVGLEPFTFNKLLPLGLGIITTGYFFWTVMAMVPLPGTAFLASLLLNQTLWMKDDLVSATPRAFIYPLFVAFIYYWIQFDLKASPHSPSALSRAPLSSTQNWTAWRSLILGAGAIALLGLFYPQYVLVAGGVVVLSLVRWSQNTLMITRSKTQWVRVSLYLIVIAAVIAFYGLTASAYDPVVTVSQAKAMPEFWPGGRNFFFSENLWWFYGVGDRSGFLHVGLVRPATLALGVFLPLMLWRSPHHPVLQHCQPSLSLLLKLLVSASGLFILAHLLLFRLHLPSRYTDHSLRIIMAIAAALVITSFLEWLVRPRSPSRPMGYIWGRMGLAILLSVIVVIYPVFVEGFPLTKYKQGHSPKLYDFFRQQPVDTLVASVAEDVNNIPVFAQRSILIGREYAIPYHLGFYDEFHERAVDVLRAQYSADPEVAIAVIQRYGIDYWMLDENAYEPDYLEDHWTRQYLDDFDIQPKESPGAAMQQGIAACTVVTQHRLMVLETDCLVEVLRE
ncbi:MAG: hypothetical protein VKL39_10435 [Leptolyngbyaceae bacterium]|nr:hypothetical protein [Leptolyngbyaceae bacterium]